MARHEDKEVMKKRICQVLKEYPNPISRTQLSILSKIGYYITLNLCKELIAEARIVQNDSPNKNVYYSINNATLSVPEGLGEAA
jgi:hypothetical protein